MPAVVSTSCWPFVVVRCPSTIDGAWVDGLVGGFAQVFERREPFAIVCDTSAVSGLPGAKERKRIADWASEPTHLDLQKRYCMGSAAILKSAVVRGTLQAIYWLYTPPAPQYAARDLDDAWTWCVGKLEARSVAIPTSRDALRRSIARELEQLVTPSTM